VAQPTKDIHFDHVRQSRQSESLLYKFIISYKQVVKPTPAPPVQGNSE
jgi:hypothetical protein